MAAVNLTSSVPGLALNSGSSSGCMRPSALAKKGKATRQTPGSSRLTRCAWRCCRYSFQE